MYHFSSGRTLTGEVICSGQDTHHSGPESYGQPAAPPHAPGRISCPHNEIAVFRGMGAEGAEQLAEAMGRLAVVERKAALSAAAAAGAAAARAAVAEHFECSICRDVCVEPSTQPCGHTFCLDHIKQWAEQQGAAEAACPLCKEPLPLPAHMRVSFAARAAIDAALRVRLLAPASGAAGSASASASASSSSAPAVPSILYDALTFECNRRGNRIELGRGAFASVYAAMFRGEAVAVKALALPPGADAAAAERALQHEAAVQYHLRHEAIVPLLGVCIDREAPEGAPTELAMVMPRMARSLESVLTSSSGSGSGGSGGGGGSSSSSAGGAAQLPPLAERLAWLLATARALRFLHASGLMHGDLKPANILLDSSGRARVCDFGHARLRGDDAAASASLGGAGGGGTPRYRDPAVTSGANALRKASDMYSFGVLAWQVLSGEVPFAGMEVAALLAHAAAGGRPHEGALPPALPAAVRHLVLQCMLGAQQDRPTAAAACAVLEGAG